ncbi:hypothetical protein GCM10008933_00100 [Paenibacillus motobuensis]|uniref:Cytosine-specific methyltransferase n=2 Tax=Paenibacillus motobuensis TaxID=295324 RepID=A0ABN0XUA3_9BACL
MAVGLKAAGYDIEFANDFDKRAAEAYAHNIGDHVVCGDITDEAIQLLIPDSDVIAGGPPCQDYSVAGTGAGEEGERGKLVWTYLGVIARKQPKAFVFENVKGLVSKKHRATFDALLAHFDSINYNVSWRVVNAWDYGVAQKRERVIAVGIRKDLGFTFEFPEPSAEEYRTQVLRDVIGDLPEPSDYYYSHPRNYGRRGVYGSSEPAPAVRAHCNRPMPAGYKPHERDANVIQYENHERKDISNKALEGYERRGGTGGFGFRVNEWDNASPTIFGRIANEGKAFVHPETKPQPRRFTVRECLRIQSVPDWYVLPDSISLSAQYRIVGNGVASRVSYKIGVALAEQLNAALAELTEETGNPPSETPELEAAA